MLIINELYNLNLMNINEKIKKMKKKIAKKLQNNEKKCKKMK